MRKPVLLKFPKKSALDKVIELEQYFTQDFCFTGDDVAIVFYVGGSFENFTSINEARIHVVGPIEEEYVRGDRKISKKIKELVTEWVQVNNSKYADEEEEVEIDEDDEVEVTSKSDLIREVKEYVLSEEKDPSTLDSLILKVIENEENKEKEKVAAAQKPTVVPSERPTVAKPDAANAISQLLHSIFGKEIPQGVGVHITKPPKNVLPVVAYEKTNGDIRKLTLKDLQLFALLFGATKELRKSNLNGISLNVKDGTIGPDDASLPFSITEVESVIKFYVDQEE
jgi:hypothetical protein